MILIEFNWNGKIFAGRFLFAYVRKCGRELSRVFVCMMLYAIKYKESERGVYLVPTEIWMANLHNRIYLQFVWLCAAMLIILDWTVHVERTRENGRWKDQSLNCGGHVHAWCIPATHIIFQYQIPKVFKSNKLEMHQIHHYTVRK